MRVVTIDGPAGAGKSTVARRVADRLGWRFLDTGAMYRAVTLAALRRRMDPADEEAVARLAEALAIELTPGRVLLDGEDVSAAIRDPDVTAAIGPVADNPRARAVLMRAQRAFAARHDTVTEGRDQGTIVFPDALRKFFLTASPEERARRRHAELGARGDPTADPGKILDQIRVRDARDEARAIAPLRPAPGAVVVDTTGLGLDQVVERLLAEIATALEPPR
jgi:cytidylate kinase